MLLALQCRSEAGGGVSAPLRLGLADKARVHLLDLVVFSVGRLVQVRQRGGNTTRDSQVADAVDRLGTSRLQEELGNLGMPFLHGLHGESGVFQARSRLARNS